MKYELLDCTTSAAAAMPSDVEMNAAAFVGFNFQAIPHLQLRLICHLVRAQTESYKLSVLSGLGRYKKSWT